MAKAIKKAIGKAKVLVVISAFSKRISEEFSISLILLRS
jgi:hypothetical protein